LRARLRQRQGRRTAAPLQWRGRRAQRGLSLVELMVAIVVGAIVVLLASVLLVIGNKSFASQGESVSLDDGGRFAIEAISRSVRQAAFVNWDVDGSAAEQWSNASASVAGLDARSLSKASDGIDDPRADAVNGSDVLALRFAGAGPAPGGDGSIVNCAGFGVPASAKESERGWSIFYVARADDGETELRCKYRGKNSWSADAIVRGVDSFQVLYGVDTDPSPDGVANAYLSATALNMLDDALDINGTTEQERAHDFNRKTHWKRVTSIRIGMLLHGPRNTREGDPPANYDLFGLAYSALHGMRDHGTRISESQMPPELKGRSRQVFGVTIVLRNPLL
jgi:type IV pilus assembly protein PilW